MLLIEKSKLEHDHHWLQKESNNWKNKIKGNKVDFNLDQIIEMKKNWNCEEEIRTCFNEANVELHYRSWWKKKYIFDSLWLSK